MKVLTVAQMQKAERESSRYDISLAQLMENAGLAVALEMRKTLGEIKSQRIAVLVGPGNNGGDGLVAARHLHEWGAGVLVYLCGARDSPHLAQIATLGIPSYQAETDSDSQVLARALAESTAILDALFGTGTSRPFSGYYVRVLSILTEFRNRRAATPLFALDLPSGLNADSGVAEAGTPFADYTLTLGFPKVGLFQRDGINRAGRIAVLDIGIPQDLVQDVDLDLLTDEMVAKMLPSRPLSSHKGSFGRVLALAGSIRYPGAAYLACTASLRAGAGLTTLAIARSLLPILAAKLTEVTYLPLPEREDNIAVEQARGLLVGALAESNCWLVGSGLGQGKDTRDLLVSTLAASAGKLLPMLIDADGLNLLAGLADWTEKVPAGTVLTPHPGEMSRLLGLSIAEVQDNRFALARQAAAKWKMTVVLKGAYTLIAAPDGKLLVSPFANPGLASAGTGDVLAGTIAGLISQGVPPADAAACGVYLHGKAGENVRQRLGEAGMLASDLLPELPLAIRQLRRG